MDGCVCVCMDGFGRLFGSRILYSMHRSPLIPSIPPQLLASLQFRHARVIFDACLGSSACAHSTRDSQTSSSLLRC